jgi:hypothetical protein
VEEITKLVEFEVLKPDAVGSFLTGNEDFKFKEFLTGVSKFEDNGEHIEDNLILYILFLVGVLMIMAVLMVLGLTRYCACRYKDKVDKLVQRVKDQIFWNTFIVTISVSYAQLCVKAGAQIKDFL